MGRLQGVPGALDKCTLICEAAMRILAGKGSRRARWTLGACAVLPVPAYFVAVVVAESGLRELGPRAAWITVLLFSLLAVMTVACVIPQRVPDPHIRPFSRA
jgi:hypothetical protein